ncbi:CBS domain-containing protein [Labrys monachus]|uniref:CBS domain-containing protein n=1 Tax=Labrys monachus TaxID=217067 RepID=A0ABU0FFC3_9HYPH|nr:CBS domain-containing protein [Labrys monachus]MDQ0393310.1 CBS domain-containing protein [Labrys monachus]
MTRKVIGISPEATIADAVDLMVRSNVSGLPVVDASGALVGILSEGDLLRRPELGTQKPRAHWLECLFHSGKVAEAYAHTHGRVVEEIMTREPISIGEDMRLEEAVALMEGHGVKRLPVVREGKVVGIISRADFVRALASFVRQSYTDSLVGDRQIKAAIEAELRAEPWAPVGTVTIDVQDGVVELQGIITDETLRNAIRVLAENVEGVKTVHDRMTWVDPYSGISGPAPEEDAKGHAA